jgi:hypothetical protein
MLAAGIEGGLAEGIVDVGNVGDLGMVERHQHLGLDHALDIIVGRHDHVIAGIAGPQLGEQLVVVGIEVHLHLDAGLALEVLQRGLADIGVPVVEVELLFFLGHGLVGHEGEADEGGAGALEDRTAGRHETRFVSHSSYSLFS